MWMVGMWKTDLRIQLTEEERDELERLSRSLVASHRAVERARTVLLLADGASVSEVARRMGRGRRIVRKWGVRFQKKRLRGLEDLAGRGRRARFSPRGGSAAGQAGMRDA